MLAVRDKLPQPYFLKESSYNRLNKVIWNTVSLIIFPIGICRAVCHLLDKHIISKLILPSTIPFFRDQDSIDNIEKTVKAHKLNNSTVTKCKIKTAEGLCLDGVSVVSSKQKTLPKKDQKWLIYALPNM